MKRVLFILAILFLGSVFLCTPAMALPTLQLDIDPGIYNSSTGTTVATSDIFTLRALLDASKDSTLLQQEFIISMAVTPQVSSNGGNLGSFLFDGTTIRATTGMNYGVPPVQTLATDDPKGDLQNHSIFPTYFVEKTFQFDDDPNLLLPSYNVADGSASPGFLNYRDFSVNVTGLDDAYAIHFDLYYLGTLTKGKTTIYNAVLDFAPFSHDAESGVPVPEPATMMLLGSGLIGLAVFGRKRFLKGA